MWQMQGIAQRFFIPPNVCWALEHYRKKIAQLSFHYCSWLGEPHGDTLVGLSEYCWWNMYNVLLCKCVMEKKFIVWGFPPSHSHFGLPWSPAGSWGEGLAFFSTLPQSLSPPHPRITEWGISTFPPPPFTSDGTQHNFPCPMRHLLERGIWVCCLWSHLYILLVQNIYKPAFLSAHRTAFCGKMTKARARPSDTARLGETCGMTLVCIVVV